MEDFFSKAAFILDNYSLLNRKEHCGWLMCFCCPGRMATAQKNLCCSMDDSPFLFTLSNSSLLKESPSKPSQGYWEGKKYPEDCILVLLESIIWTGN